MPEPKAAVLDLGTNTFHLLVAQPDGAGGLSVLEREETFVKIGQGGVSEGRISPEAEERAVACLRRYRVSIDRHAVPPERVQAIATSAIRSAANGSALLGRIERETGFRPRAVSGREEAELIYEGVKTALPLEVPALICDVGGGSVEVVLADGEGLRWRESYEIGAQRLLDRFHRTDPLPPASQKELYAFLESTMSGLFAEAAAFPPRLLVGTAGTFDTVREVHSLANGIPVDFEAVPALTVSAEAYRAVHRRFVETPLAERLAIPGMLAPRAEMIVVASCVADFLIGRLALPEVALCRAALKEGALAQLLRS